MNDVVCVFDDVFGDVFELVLNCDWLKSVCDDGLSDVF